MGLLKKMHPNGCNKNMFHNNNNNNNNNNNLNKNKKKYIKLIIHKIY
jgi:hypothetical protein